MSILQITLILLVALEHFYICYIEMFAWEKMGKKILPKENPLFLSETKGMAANQGLYNAFLAAGLIWSVLIPDLAWATNVATFFLVCIIVAASFGALRSDRGIFLKQGLPSVVAIIALYLF